MDEAYSSSPEEVLDFFGVNIKVGLSEKQVKDHGVKYGRNEFTEEEGTPFWKLVLNQFEDTLVRILLGAALVSFVLALFEEGEDRFHAFVEPIIIILILIANATVGVLQERRAEEAIEALKKYEAKSAFCLRDGRYQSIPCIDLVPGDVVELKVGECVSADIRVIEIPSSCLMTDQALLTGESFPVKKVTEARRLKEAVISDKTNILFSGSNVVQGTGRGVVVCVGDKTEIGKIRSMMSEAEQEDSPLKKKLDEFGDLLAKVIAVICIVVWAINIGHFNDPAFGGWVKGAMYYFKIAVALAVAAIPEGLPAVVTTCLALGTRRMATKNAIVRHLASVETLGCTSVICSDKTGTLTTNMMSIQKVVCCLKGGRDVSEFDVEGTSFAPTGGIIANSTPISHPAGIPTLRELSKIGVLCNESNLEYKLETGEYCPHGTATEVAIKVLAEKIGRPDADEDKQRAKLVGQAKATFVSDFYKRQFETKLTFEFARDRKSMSVLVLERNTGKYTLAVKGAPEEIFLRANRVMDEAGNVMELTPELRDKFTKRTTDLGTGLNTLRCLALAVREGASETEYDMSDPKKFADYEKDLILVGVVGMLDPPRPAVKAAIERCNTAGIKVIVITGDNQQTAEAICRRIGIFGPTEDLTHGRSFTGREFDQMSDARKTEIMSTVGLFSRVEPKHKYDIVQCLKKMNQICAMTGDGVNDAVALVAADIGIAMGSGTDVAKGASDMVLADDNFGTIVSAVEEGRGIYNNMKQFIRYLISSNIGEVVSIFFTASVGMPEALIPVQLLWVNLVTDGLPATALSFNPTDEDIMEKPPRAHDEAIVTPWLFFRYMVIGVYIGVGTCLAYAWWYMHYANGPQISWDQLISHHTCVSTASFDCSMFKTDKRASTMSLSVLVTIEMFNALNSLSENQSIISMPPWLNPLLIYAVILSFALHFAILYIPFLATIFSVAPLGVDEWIAVLAFSFPVVFLDELLKLLSRYIQTSSASYKTVTITSEKKRQ